MKELLKKGYLFVHTIPDRMYPFATEMEGHFVRGRESYKQAVQTSFQKYGPNHFGLKLTFYRGTFHLLGSIVFIVMSTYVSQQVFGSEVALYALMSIMIAGIFIQEFYWQPRVMGQLRYKGIFDLLTWATPMLLYFIL